VGQGQAQGNGEGSWLVVHELLERGDPAFVNELRAISDADALGAFAARWYADSRSASRRLVFAYLERPPNAYRHETLVKRLFKLAEGAEDDEVMARFLVLFDRSVRRVRRTRRHYESQVVPDRAQADALSAAWLARGFDSVNLWTNWQGRLHVVGIWTESVVGTSRASVMPRGRLRETPDFTSWSPMTGRYKSILAPDWVTRLKLDPNDFRNTVEIPEAHRLRLERFRLFSTATRNYLRRRSWRYFRKLGRRAPERYVAAVSEALLLYRDDDVADALALLDNWGLVHILFHHSPDLVARPDGWWPAEGRTMSDLAPAPMYKPLWKRAPRAVVDLMVRGGCRPVRQWAARVVRSDLAAAVSLDELLGWLGHEDTEVVDLAAELLRSAPGLDDLSADRWLELAETPNPAALELIFALMERHLRPETLTLAQAVRMASSRPLPMARLGLRFLRGRVPRGEEECLLLLGLVEAESEPIRAEIVRWARGVLAEAPGFHPDWVLSYLDSRHRDVRAEGWAWLRDEPRTRDDVALWQRLMESPYDDVRLALVADLEGRLAGHDLGGMSPLALDPERLRLLWASVLLNIHRGGRAKPMVVRQLLRRLDARPRDLGEVLPILAVALRSVRGPEWRAGLTALVQLVDRQPDAAPIVHAAFPELQWA